MVSKASIIMRVFLFVFLCVAVCGCVWLLAVGGWIAYYVVARLFSQQRLRPLRGGNGARRFGRSSGVRISFHTHNVIG
jgi:hypothetical protein